MSSIRSKEPRFSARPLLLSTVIRRSTAIGTERIKKAWVSKQTRKLLSKINPRKFQSSNRLRGNH